MRGQKGKDIIGEKVTFLSDWPWVYPEYEFEIDFSKDEIQQIIIDPSTRLADVLPENNTLDFSSKDKDVIRFKSNN